MDNVEIKFLPVNFTGRGEVRGFKFTQLRKTNRAFMYEIDTGDQIHYECFKRLINKRYSCESYPGSKSFGITAFTFMKVESAIEKFNQLNSCD